LKNQTQRCLEAIIINAVGGGESGNRGLKRGSGEKQPRKKKKHNERFGRKNTLGKSPGEKEFHPLGQTISSKTGWGKTRKGAGYNRPSSRRLRGKGSLLRGGKGRKELTA